MKMFPHHHRATTAMPIDWRMTERDPAEPSDFAPAAGTKTVWIGETELRRRLKWTIGLSMMPDPIVVQYFRYLGDLCHGDLGVYGATKVSVAEKIGQALPITLELTFAGLVIALILSVVLGVISALYRDRWPDR